MSEINGCSQCGQYPASLFKTPNERQGLEPANKLDLQQKALNEDKVTLSSDAITIANAQLRASTQIDPSQSSESLAIRAVTESSAAESIALGNQQGDRSYSVTASLQNTSTSSTSSFYTRA